MKKIESCEVENCIPIPSSCVEWNGGDVEFLGICDGDSINDAFTELVSKVKDVSVDTLADFDIDSLLSICGQSAPFEITTTSILNIVKANEVCLKDSIETLSEQIAAITASSLGGVNLKCFATFDNLGNSLVVTRESFDQLLIDNQCDEKARLDSIEGIITNLQSEINNLELNTTVEELTFGTCIDASILPTSTQVIATAQAHCDLEDATGDAGDISSALASTPTFPTAVTLDPGYIVSPSNLAENYNNLLIAFSFLQDRVEVIETTCCAISCDDVKIGFSAVFSDASTLTIRFTAGAGTLIPAGWNDSGSSVTITDVDGNTVTENITIANNSEHDISILGLSQAGNLSVMVTAIMTNGSMTCERCIGKTITTTGACDFCEICATGDLGSKVTIVYEDDSQFVGTSFNPSTSTTTTTTAPSTTTTTTLP